MDKRNASRITSSRSVKSATFHLTGWSLSHQTELPGDPPVPLQCHALTLNTIELQLSDEATYTSMLQCSAQLRIPFNNAHYLADNASHALASSTTVKSTFNVEEEVVVIRNGWIPKEVDLNRKNIKKEKNLRSGRTNGHYSHEKIQKIQHIPGISDILLLR